MKKSLFVALVACVALVFASCEKNNGQGGSKVTAITISQTELSLLTGEEFRLSVKATPETASITTSEITWTSSDSTVATVSGNGTVSALAVGTANITAKYNDLTAVCKVTVEEWADNLKFTGVYFGVSDTAAYGDKIDTIQASSGAEYKVKRVKAYVALFTEGFYINESSEFDGLDKGAIVEAYAPIYWAPGWANGTQGGTIFVLGNWYINEAACDTLTQVLPVGNVNAEYLANMKLFLENINKGDQTTAYSVNMKAAGDAGCEGAVMTVYQYHSVEEGYASDGYYSSYIPDLFFQNSGFVADNNYTASSYMCSIEAHILNAKELKNEEVSDSDFYAYGCYWHYDETNGYSWNNETISWGKDYRYELNADQFENAPKRMPVKCADFETTQKIIKKIHAVPTDKVAKL